MYTHSIRFEINPAVCVKMLIEVVLLAAVAWFLLRKFMKSKNRYFEGRNIEYDPYFPVLGSFKSMMLKKRSFLDLMVDLYKKAGDNK